MEMICVFLLEDVTGKREYIHSYFLRCEIMYLYFNIKTSYLTGDMGLNCFLVI